MDGMEVWRFETKSFTVVFEALPECDADMSWDESGDVSEKIKSGEYDLFCAHVYVLHNETGAELGNAYLGECIYERASDFRNHFGLAAKSRVASERAGRAISYGSYFPEMVKEAIGEARTNLAKLRAA